MAQCRDCLVAVLALSQHDCGKTIFAPCGPNASMDRVIDAAEAAANIADQET